MLAWGCWNCGAHGWCTRRTLTGKQQAALCGLKVATRLKFATVTSTTWQVVTDWRLVPSAWLSCGLPGCRDRSRKSAPVAALVMTPTVAARLVPSPGPAERQPALALVATPAPAGAPR